VKSWLAGSPNWIGELPNSRRDWDCRAAGSMGQRSPPAQTPQGPPSAAQAELPLFAGLAALAVAVLLPLCQEE